MAQVLDLADARVDALQALAYADLQRLEDALRPLLGAPDARKQDALLGVLTDTRLLDALVTSALGGLAYERKRRDRENAPEWVALADARRIPGVGKAHKAVVLDSGERVFARYERAKGAAGWQVRVVDALTGRQHGPTRFVGVWNPAVFVATCESIASDL